MSTFEYVLKGTNGAKTHTKTITGDKDATKSDLTTFVRAVEKGLVETKVFNTAIKKQCTSFDVSAGA